MRKTPKLFTEETETEWPGEVNLAELLNEIRNTIRTHVVVNAKAAIALAVWVVHTYVFELRDAVAYVAIESPEKRCGKTTLLSVLAGLASKPLIASNITAGALFRAIDEASPTLLIDEADTFLAGNGTMRGILNCGNTWRTAFVVRLRKKGEGARETEVAGETMKKEGELEKPPAEGSLVSYGCYCPKVVAMIGQVPETLADRSIVVKMSRKFVEETCVPLKDFHPGQIRAKCKKFARQNEQIVKDAPQERLEGLNDRAADTYEPLAVIARMAGENWLQELTQAAAWLTSSQNVDSKGPTLLLDVLEILLTAPGMKMFSRDLAGALRGERGFVPTQHFAEKKVTEQVLATTLRRYGARPSTMRIGREVNKGYSAQDFREALQHYVPRADIDARLEEIKKTDAIRQELADELGKEVEVQEAGRLLKLAKLKLARLEAMKGSSQALQEPLPEGFNDITEQIKAEIVDLQKKVLQPVAGVLQAEKLNETLVK